MIVDSPLPGLQLDSPPSATVSDTSDASPVGVPDTSTVISDVSLVFLSDMFTAISDVSSLGVSDTSPDADFDTSVVGNSGPCPTILSDVSPVRVSVTFVTAASDASSGVVLDISPATVSNASSP